MIFNMETSSNTSDNETLLCYSKCSSKETRHPDKRSIYLDMINFYPEEKIFVLSATIREIILECVGSNQTIESCGENYSSCRPLITKFPHANGTCCIQEITDGISKLDWSNFLGFPEEVDCLMKCIRAKEGIFNKRGEPDALNVYTNTEFVDIAPERKQTFRRCVLNGSGVHTCKEIIRLYTCFFRNMKKADPREWLYN